MCGDEVLAASLATPGVGYCRLCLAGGGWAVKLSFPEHLSWLALRRLRFPRTWLLIKMIIARFELRDMAVGCLPGRRPEG